MRSGHEAAFAMGLSRGIGDGKARPGHRVRVDARRLVAAGASRRAATHEDAARRALFVGRRRQPDFEGRVPHGRGGAQCDQRVPARRQQRRGRDRPGSSRGDDRHAGLAPGHRQRRAATDLRCPRQHAVGAGRGADLERRRQEGAAVRCPRFAKRARSLRRDLLAAEVGSCGIDAVQSQSALP